jgi:hypothetical protein
MLGVIGSSFSFAIAKFGDRLSEAKTNNEKGFVLVYCSITLLVVTALGGFAVDVGNWYSKAGRLQSAADAAALAGAPYLPGDVPAAIAAAESSLKENGFSLALVNDKNGGVHGGTGAKKDTPTAFVKQDPEKPTRLIVEIGNTYPTFFTSLLGYNQQTLIREATATYRMAIPMGNPGVVLGYEPKGAGFDSVQNVSADTTGNGTYWLNIAGGKSDKINGDKYTAMRCTASAVDGCSDNTTDDYKEGDKVQGGHTRAHQYLLHVPASVSGKITLQVFDGAFVDVGSGCNVAQARGNVNPEHGGKDGLDLTDPQLASVASANGLPSNLYGAGPDNQACTGDAASSLPGSHSLNKAPELSLAVYNVTGDIEGKLDEQVGKTATYPSVTVKDSTSLANQLATNEDGIRDSFRRWNTFVTIDVPSTKDSGYSYSGYDYIIRAETPEDSYGNNHYSLRAGLGSEGSWNQTGNKGMSLSAQGHMAVFTNAKSNTSRFYFAKFTDSQAGRTIDVNLFDIGDGPAPISVNLIKPSKATGIGTGFGKCEQLGPDTYKSLRNPCNISYATRTMSGGIPGYDGRNVTLHFKLPDDYRCADDGGSGCWMALEFTTDKPASDTTTWEILDCGRPLRLIQPGQPEAMDSCPSPSGVQATPEEPVTTTTTTKPSTTTTAKQTTTTKKPSTTTTKKPGNTTTSQRPGTSTTKKPTTTTQRPPSTSTTKKPTTTTSKPNTTTTKKPATTTTIYIGGT